jgi:lipid-A-disaccharide synthase
MNPKKIYIITGEASGDLHGGKLCQEIRKLVPDIIIRGWGGEHLAAAGAQLDVRYEDVNFMGFSEVLKNLRKILNLFRVTKKTILEFKPDAVILVDYPGFNLRMAQWCRIHGIPVYYYIAPQVWAWKENRVKILKECVRKLFILLPFEKDFFSKHGINSSYYGHPLIQLTDQFKLNPEFRNINSLSNQSIVALLPGSRRQEIKTMLPIYLESFKGTCRYQLVIAGMRQHANLYQKILSQTKVKAQVIYNDTYNILHQARFAIVTSGTASLETGLFGVPEIVCYKGNWFSYLLAKKLIKVKYICLINLIANKKIVQELIQKDCNPETLRDEFNKLRNPQVRKRIRFDLKNIHNLLSGEQPYKNVANEIVSDLQLINK